MLGLSWVLRMQERVALQGPHAQIADGFAIPRRALLFRDLSQLTDAGIDQGPWLEAGCWGQAGTVRNKPLWDGAVRLEVSTRKLEAGREEREHTRGQAGAWGQSLSDSHLVLAWTLHSLTHSGLFLS